MQALACAENTHWFAVNQDGFSFVSGIGLALIYLPSMVMVGYYFEKRRPIASGIASSGSGFGMVIFAPLAAYFTNEYDWRGALTLLAGVTLQGLVLGAVMRPLELPQQKHNSQLDSQLTDEDSLEQTGPLLETPVVEIKHSSSGPLKRDESVQLYRRAVENAFSRQRANTVSHGNRSDVELSSPEEKKNASSGGINSVGVFGFTDRGRSKSDTEINETQSCQELAARTPIMEKRGHKGDFRAPHSKLLMVPIQASASHTRAAQSCHEIAAKSHHASHHGISEARAKVIHDLLNPLRRQDVLYTGSVASLPQYKSHPDLKSYLASVTVLPEPGELEDTSLCQRARRGLLHLLDLTILTNPSFLVICLASVFIQVGYFIPIVYLVDYAVSLGSSTQQAAVIISVIGTYVQQRV